MDRFGADPVTANNAGERRIKNACHARIRHRLAGGRRTRKGLNLPELQLRRPRLLG